MATLVCVPIMVDEFAEAEADARQARDLGADLVEYRIDRVFDSFEDDHAVRLIEALVADSPLPCIVTCRPTWEGGEYDGDDSDRISLYERLGLAERPPRYIDVELAALTRSANLRQKVRLAVEHPGQGKGLSTSLVLSMHDFEQRPADLNRRWLAMLGEDAARVHKIAYRVRSVRDNLELLELTREADRPTIALGMGEFGLLSRVLAPKFGGFLTFAALAGGKGTAPGQPTIGELLGLYHFRSISASTKVYGVVGWPVDHSLSPLVHNAGFEAVGHDGVYLPIPVPTGEDEAASDASFKATVLELIEHDGLDLCGLSVTLPHKERLVRLARERGWEIDGDAARIGAANTITVDRENGRVGVANTDAPAAIESLEEAAGSVAGKRVAVVGAGGVARAIAAALVERGAEVVICNRTRSRADALAEVVGAWACDLEELDGRGLTAVVNATSAGMSSGSDRGAMAVPAGVLDRMGDGTVVFETVYSPLVTPLVEAARERGLAVVDGATMFVRQAAAQFRGWTGVPPPLELFDRIVRERLESAS